MQAFAQLLRQHLKSRSITQKAFAESVGRSYVYVNKVALGQRGQPDDVETWAEVLELHGDEREVFLDTAALMVSPLRVQNLVARLEMDPRRSATIREPYPSEE